MAVVIKPITVEVSKPNIFQAIAAKQNDCNSRFLKVTFVNEGEKIFITPAAKVTINAIRNDGKSESFFGTVNADGTATVPIHSWILELVGDVACDVSIIEADSKLTCTSFSLLIEKATRNSDDVSQDPQYDVLTELIKSVNVLDDEMIAYTEATYTKIPRTVALEARTSAVEKRVTNLEQGILPSPFETDSGVAHQKSVPTNALPYAEVSKVGGMTRKCANLIPYPYLNYPKTENGITWTINADGSITANGTATDWAFFNLLWDANLATVSFDSPCTVDGKTFTDCSYNHNNGHLYVFISPNETVTNKTFYPMANYGETALPYEPFFEGLRSAPVEEVESVGANRFEPSNRFEAVAGCEVQAVNGTYTVKPLGYDPYWFPKADDFHLDYGEQYYFYSFVTGGAECHLRCDDGQGGASGITFVYNVMPRLPHFELEHSTIGQTYEVKIVISKYPIEEYVPFVRNTLPIPSAVQAKNGINEDVYDFIEWREDGTRKNYERVGKVDLGTLDWDWYEPGFFAVNMNNYPALNKAGGSNYISDTYRKISDRTDAEMANAEDMTICSNKGGSGSWVNIKDTKYGNDANAFKAGVSGSMLYYELAEPIITDISDLITADNLIGVEGGGTVTFKNPHEYAVPSEITYQIKGANV